MGCAVSSLGEPNLVQLVGIEDFSFRRVIDATRLYNSAATLFRIYFLICKVTEVIKNLLVVTSV